MVEQTELVFGKLIEVIPVSQKTELHVKVTADAVHLAKYVRTQKYTGYTGGMMIPKVHVEALIKALVKATSQ